MANDERRPPRKPKLQVIQGGNPTVWDLLSPEDRAILKAENDYEINALNRIFKQCAIENLIRDQLEAQRAGRPLSTRPFDPDDIPF